MKTCMHNVYAVTDFPPMFDFTITPRRLICNLPGRRKLLGFSSFAISVAKGICLMEVGRVESALGDYPIVSGVPAELSNMSPSVYGGYPGGSSRPPLGYNLYTTSCPL